MTSGMATVLRMYVFSSHFVSAILLILAFVNMIVSVSSAQESPKMQCAWNEYYDEIMDDCGPCHEICDSMTLTRTETQCKTQCSDYLVSKSCRSDQYFDEKVMNCAPCAELCSESNAKGTNPECFQKCRNYVDTNQPSNIQVDSDQNTDTSTGPSSSSSFSSWLPGIIVSIFIGGMASIATVGLIIRYRYTKYTRAPRNDARGHRGDTTTRNGGLRHDSNAIEMEERQPALPIQVSSEEFTSQDISIQQQSTSAEAEVDDEDTQLKTVSVGIAECDPVAPSSAAAWHVRRQHSS